MRNARILVIGVSATTNEVIKNIVLAGIGSLTILDDKTVESRHLGGQFFLEEADIGKNIAEAIQYRVQRLNPRVGLEVDNEGLGIKLNNDEGKEWIGSFDVIIASDLKFQQLIDVNNITRAAGKSFYATESFGLYGYVFADLIEHKYTIEKEKSNIRTVLGPETKTRSVVHVETKKDGQRVLEAITKGETYKSLADITTNKPVFAVKYSGRRLLRVSGLLPILLTYWDTQSQPSIETVDQFHENVVEKARILGIPASTVKRELVQSFISSINTELSPVAAVVGGVLAQDVLNILGQKEQPIQNIFIFNGSTSEGPIYTLI